MRRSTCGGLTRSTGTLRNSLPKAPTTQHCRVKKPRTQAYLRWLRKASLRPEAHGYVFTVCMYAGGGEHVCHSTCESQRETLPSRLLFYHHVVPKLDARCQAFRTVLHPRSHLSPGVRFLNVFTACSDSGLLEHTLQHSPAISLHVHMSSLCRTGCRQSSAKRSTW